MCCLRSYGRGVHAETRCWHPELGFAVPRQTTKPPGTFDAWNTSTIWNSANPITLYFGCGVPMYGGWCRRETFRARGTS